MSLLSDIFGDGSPLDKMQKPPEWTQSQPAGDMNAIELLEAAPLAAMRECASGFEQWYDEYRVGWDPEAIGKVRAWVAQVVDYLNRDGARLP